MAREGVPTWLEPTKRWRFRCGGRQFYNSDLGPGQRRKALEWASEIQSRIGEAGQPSGAYLFSAAAAWFLEWHKAHGSSHRTIDQYRAELVRHVKLVGDRPIGEVRPIDLSRALRAMEVAGLSSTTRAHHAKVILALMAWCTRPEPDRCTEDGRPLPDHLLAHNPLAGFRRPRALPQQRRLGERLHLASILRQARSEIEPWKRGTLGRCMTCMVDGGTGPCRRAHDLSRQRLRDTLVLLRVAAATGARPGELCGARWEDWQPRAGRDGKGHHWGVLMVDHKTQKFTGRKRPILVPPALARALERMRSRSTRHPDYIWTHRRGRGSGGTGQADWGTPWKTTALACRVRAWRERAIEAGRPVPEGWSIYWMRHAYYSKVAPTLGAELAGMLGGDVGPCGPSNLSAYPDRATDSGGGKGAVYFAARLIRSIAAAVDGLVVITTRDRPFRGGGGVAVVSNASM